MTGRADNDIYSPIKKLKDMEDFELDYTGEQINEYLGKAGNLAYATPEDIEARFGGDSTPDTMGTLSTTN